MVLFHFKEGGHVSSAILPASNVKKVMYKDFHFLMIKEWKATVRYGRKCLGDKKTQIENQILCD